MERVSASAREKNTSIANLCTFFDCADYRDFTLILGDNGRRERTKSAVGILTRSKGKISLGFIDNLELILDIITGKRDGHGGYFRGEFSRELIYRLAFLGFEGYLKTIDDDKMRALSTLNRQCEQKRIKGFLSPLRYRVDIQGADLEETKYDLTKKR